MSEEAAASTSYSNDGLVWTSLFMAASLLLQSVCIYFFVFLQTQKFYFFIAHLIISALNCGYCYWCKRKNWDLRFCTLSAIFSLVAGPVGILWAFGIMVLFLIYIRNANDFMKWLDGLYPEYRSKKLLTLSERIRSDWEDFSGKEQLVSYREVLKYGDRFEKAAVLANIAKNFQPSLAPILRLALNDEIAGIRVQAAGITAKFEKELADRVLTLEAVVKKGKADAPLLLKLAGLYEDNARSQVLDADNTKKCVENAKKYYKEYLKIAKDPDTLSIELLIAGMHLEVAEYDKAYEIFKDRFKTMEEIPEKLLLSYSKCLYELKKFDKLKAFSRQIVGKFESQEFYDYTIRANALLWAKESG